MNATKLKTASCIVTCVKSVQCGVTHVQEDQGQDSHSDDSQLDLHCLWFSSSKTEEERTTTVGVTGILRKVA